MAAMDMLVAVLVESHMEEATAVMGTPVV